MKGQRVLGLAIGGFSGLLLGLTARALELSGATLAIFWAGTLVILLVGVVPRALDRRRSGRTETYSWSSGQWAAEAAEATPSAGIAIWQNKQLLWQHAQYRAASPREFEWRGSTYGRPTQPVEAEYPYWVVALPERSSQEIVEDTAA